MLDRVHCVWVTPADLSDPWIRREARRYLAEKEGWSWLPEPTVYRILPVEGEDSFEIRAYRGPNRVRNAFYARNFHKTPISYKKDVFLQLSG